MIDLLPVHSQHHKLGFKIIFLIKIHIKKIFCLKVKNVIKFTAFLVNMQVYI